MTAVRFIHLRPLAPLSPPLPITNIYTYRVYVDVASAGCWLHIEAEQTSPSGARRAPFCLLLDSVEPDHRQYRPNQKISDRFQTRGSEVSRIDLTEFKIRWWAIRSFRYGDRNQKSVGWNFFTGLVVQSRFRKVHDLPLKLKPYSWMSKFLNFFWLKKFLDFFLDRGEGNWKKFYLRNISFAWLWVISLL